VFFPIPMIGSAAVVLIALQLYGLQLF